MSTTTNANKIKQLRIQKGYSQERLAEEAGLGHRTIQRAEGAKTVRPATAEAIAKALAVSVADLVEPPLLMLSPGDIRNQLAARLAPFVTSNSFPTARWRVEILDIEPFSTDEDRPSSVVVQEIRRALALLGFRTSLGSCCDSRLLAKRPRTTDEIYIIHHRNRRLADHLGSIVSKLNFGPVVKVLDAGQVAKESDRIPAREVVKGDDALIAYRACFRR